MTSSVNNSPRLTSRLANGFLSIKPLANLAKQQARQMMIKRAEKIGVPWRKRVQELRSLEWDSRLSQVQNPQVTYPDYYLCSLHAYENGNLNWDAAWELECAAYAVHAKVWPGAGVKGDPRLRQSYHDIVKEQLSIEPQDILDLGCSVGLSSFALQEVYPQATITGLDLSPHFLAVAQYYGEQRHAKINWKHATAESTGLPDASFDLVSVFLMFHELPQQASREILCEARRLLRPGGYLAIMDSNPQSEAYTKMPSYVFTLFKSTEPYLDEYFAFDIEQAIVEAGFKVPTVTLNSPRHRTIVAEVGF
ncbi:MAG: class I SAM-dependent methyltransferase [Symploca sp. SIO3C6]|uniref:Class I SAM-dependent methyltransferase n=1 Tax=Symploca sp. SIO1C4 TaxID=2607765 RepID=A0A6B3NRG7_9CYAN|nr:class I SAM-dependent methyltransferase [Symploca sp. SIO3C6]NER31788.1 class I SAM-dependent methyltransferase [Symploca sp. SIO1C4]NET05566.1 class I SAM-dependent methyltransferase [Symploca sp. SIO2B6]